MSSDFSNAFNFDEAIQHNVDPRTGGYPVTFSLGDIVSHDFYGVQFSLKLRHDPLDLEEHGFGQTWSLLLTCYDKVHQKLYTSDGKQYGFDGSKTLKNYGINDFKIEVDEDNKIVDIIYRNGMRERFGTENDLNYMTTLFSADGKKLSFEYITREEEDKKTFLLSRIYDEFSSRSISLDYSNPEFVVVQHKRGDTTYLTYLCKFKNKMLDFVSLPNTTDYGTNIIYERMEIGAFISELAMPTGYHEWVTYEMGHTLPPEHPLPTTQLPYVTKVRCYNGEQQNDTVRTFTYSQDTNYLGLSGDKPWDDTYGDNIYTVPSEYTYYSVETINDLKIKRTYNKFHALTDELEYTDETKLNETLYTYYGDVSKPIDEQPRNFLFIKKISKWFFKKGTEISVGASYYYKYDEEGNLLEFSDERTLLRNEYCSAQEDPLGFVRLVKTTTKQPAAETEQAPITTTFNYINHEYCTSSGLSGSFPTIANEITNNFSKEYTYMWEDERTFGQLIKTVTKKGGEILNTETRTFNVEENYIIETFTNIGFDEVIEQRSLKYSLFNKLELERKEATGKIFQYSYDALGRPNEIKISINDKDFTSKKISYVFDTLENKVTIENSDGNKDIWLYNCKGNIFAIHRNNENMVIEETFYDGADNIIQKRINDYKADGTILYELNYKYTYDIQGRQIATKISPLLEEDDILIEEKIYDDYEKSSYAKVPGMPYKKHYYNSFGDIIKREHYNAIDELIRIEEYEYDSYARMIKFTSGNLIKRYTYDIFDRITSIYTNEGDSTTTYEYASFTTQDLMEKITIDGKVIGTRTYDSLGRITSETVPYFREKKYTYEGASHLPSTAIHGSNQIAYLNNNHLDKPLQATYTEGKTFSFTYDTEGRITQAVSEAITLGYKYDIYGFLYKQEIKIGEEERTAKELCSIRGNPILRTNFLGSDIYFKYNKNYGLISEMGDVNLKIEFTYDSINRITSRSIKKLTGDEISINCVYIYDEKFGGISSKETFINDEIAYREVYTYNKYGMIDRIEKVLPNSDNIIEEFLYDENGRLITNKYAKGSTPFASTAYTLDNFDNIVKAVTTLPDASLKTKEFVPKEGAPCVIEAIVEDGERRDLNYDDWGRIITDMDGLQYQYDTLGRMVGAIDSSGGELSSYTYDPFGVQFLQRTPDGSFCYSYYFKGMLLNCVTSDSSVSYFSDGNEIFYERRQLSDETTESYFITDYKGTVVAEISGSTVTQRYEFTVYGDLIQRTE